MTRYMGQTMAECDCTNEICSERGECIALEIAEAEIDMRRKRKETKLFIRWVYFALIFILVAASLAVGVFAYGVLP